MNLKGKNQLDLRTAYAGRRRQGLYRNTYRVLWKSKSKHIA